MKKIKLLWLGILFVIFFGQYCKKNIDHMTCSAVESISECTGSYDKIEALKGGCSGADGKLLESPCPKENSLGRCEFDQTTEMRGYKVVYYYSTGRQAYTAESAADTCTRVDKGKWIK